MRKYVKVGTDGGMVAVSPDMKLVDSFPGVAKDRQQMVAAVKDFVWNHSGDLSLKDMPRDDSILAQADSLKDSVVKQQPVKTASRKETMVRYDERFSLTRIL